MVASLKTICGIFHEELNQHIANADCTKMRTMLKWLLAWFKKYWINVRKFVKMKTIDGPQQALATLLACSASSQTCNPRFSDDKLWPSKLAKPTLYHRVIWSFWVNLNLVKMGAAGLPMMPELDLTDEIFTSTASMSRRYLSRIILCLSRLRCMEIWIALQMKFHRCR